MTLLERLLSVVYEAPADQGSGELPGLVRDQLERASAASEAPTPEPEAAAAAPETPVADQPAESAFDAPFRLEDVDPAYREHVERYVKQTQGAFTKKTQELAAQRQAMEAEAAAIAEAKALYDRLESDDERAPALRELLGRYGIELEMDEDDPDPAAAAVETGTADPRVAELEARLQAIESQRAEDANTGYVERVRDYVEEAIDGYGNSVLGLKEGEDVPDVVRDQLIAAARGLPPIEVDGEQMPNMEAAIAQVEAFRALELQRYADSKRGPDVDASGVSGSPVADMRDPKERTKRALAIAGRHLG